MTQNQNRINGQRSRRLFYWGRQIRENKPEDLGLEKLEIRSRKVVVIKQAQLRNPHGFDQTIEGLAGHQERG